MRYIIDCQTKGKKRLIHRLAGLKATNHVSDGGAYWQDETLSQIHLTSDSNASDIENWLYKNNCYYIGVIDVC